MTPRINFDEIPDGIEQGDIVPDGTYIAIIQGIVPGVTKRGQPKWDVWSEIVDGPEKGKRIKDQWLWYEKGLSRTKACISGCELTQPGDADYRPEHFVGCPVLLDVVTEMRESNGKEYPECKPRYRGYSRDPDREWNPASAPATLPPSEKQGSVFDDGSVPF